ncbi:toll/interleukin-1 receptor domain-containing protein [Parvibaculum sp.]|uniref:toll/interleukin-1 receptor domain-containing protein n=1 Tax=Parvibaculum sp. TaxID=2024848 RepID=UPI0034A034BF
MAKVFFSYSHADEALRDQLEKQLAMLRRQGAIDIWHDRRIGAGADFGREIDSHLEEADIVLLLVSADFLASDYCYDREMMRALERHEEGRAVVVPVILRACDWQGAPFGKLLATPTDGRPITQWPDRDQAFLEVTKAIKSAIARSDRPVAVPGPSKPPPLSEAKANVIGPRSSNLRLAKEFSERDKDIFKHDAFEFMAKFFENSLRELEDRNRGVETSFRRVDANRFTSIIYKNGRAISRCTIFMGGGILGAGIAYSASETNESNSYNENLTVEADELSLHLRSIGMANMGAERDVNLSFEGAAEFYWSMLISRLQR